MTKSHSRAQVSRTTRRQFHDKGKDKILPTWNRLGVYSGYQVQGAYAHLEQQNNTEATDALEAASNILYFNDPLRLSVPYHYIARIKPEPPDCFLARLTALIAITSIFAIPLLRGTIYLTYLQFRRKFQVLFYARVPSPKRRHRRHRRRRTKYRRYTSSQKAPESSQSKLIALATAKELTKKNKEDKPSVVDFDSDGIPFIIDNSANCIICNVRELFVGPLEPETTNLTTADGVSAKPRYIGSLRLKLVDNANAVWVYDIPGCIYDPGTSFNIVGIPKLREHFGDDSKLPDATCYEDGTRICSSGCRSHFVWDNGVLMEP